MSLHEKKGPEDQPSVIAGTSTGFFADGEEVDGFLDQMKRGNCSR
jgi:hypothetical protein